MGKLWTVLFAVAACSSDSPPPGTAGATCSFTADNCTDDNVCNMTSPNVYTCEAAFPRTYLMTSIDVTAAATKPDGTAWDADGSPPDIYVTVSLGGTVLSTTPVKQDAFTENFTNAQGLALALTSNSVLDVHAWDKDLTVDDSILDCVAAPVTVDDVRGHTLTCGTSSTMSMQIIPMPD